MTWTARISAAVSSVLHSLTRSPGHWRGRFPHMVIALLVFMGLSCAKQGYPPGGSIDETPPFMVSSTPALMAINVPVKDPIVIEFSEPMNEKSVEDNLFIVPIPSSWPEFIWKSKGKVLNLNLTEPFRDNTTYVISIGSKACDVRNNPLKDSIMLSFSTGNNIENGKIKGRVIPYNFFSQTVEKISGVDVVAYRMDGSTQAPDPRNDVPDYLTQSGVNGIYEIIGLSRGV